MAMFRIRNFGNDTECESIDALVSSIDQYRGKSVTIDDLRQGGRDYFVDVLPDGGVYESYGSRTRFDIECRLNQPGGN